MAYNKSPLIVKMENIVSLIQNKAEFLEFACEVICNSTVKLNEEQRKKLLTVLKGETRLSQSPVSPFLMPGEMEISNFFLLDEEVKPDTLLENSCTICGASFMDHGEKACNDYACLYNVRNPASACDTGFAADADADTEEDSSPSGASPAPLPVEEKDNWVQCDCCDTWRKIETAKGLPDKWYCSDIKKACRVPREAENYWPARRAKKAVQFCYRTYAYSYGYEPKPYKGNRVPSHMKCLKILAERKKIPLEQLYKTSPDAYFGNDYNTFSRFMYGNAHWRY